MGDEMNALKILVVAVAALVGTYSHAMDTRFKDTNGDLVADAPKDPKQWVDPSTLVFAYTPVEDPAVYSKVWQEFIDHLAKTTGKRVQFFPVQSNAAQIEAMRSGRLHVAGCVFRSNWTLIPRQTDYRFHRKLDS